MYVSHVQIHVQYLFVQYYVRAWQHYPIGVYVLQLYSTDGMYMFPAHFSFGRVTALGVLCWFALLLLTFFLLHLSLTCIAMGGCIGFHDNVNVCSWSPQGLSQLSTRTGLHSAGRDSRE